MQEENEYNKNRQFQSRKDHDTCILINVVNIFALNNLKHSIGKNVTSSFLMNAGRGKYLSDVLIFKQQYSLLKFILQ